MTWSLRRRLLVWLTLALVAIGALGLIDTRAEALRTAQGVSDRILAGSALAIAERVTVSAQGGLEVMIPFSALEMLSSTAEDLVFYRVDGPAGFVTGYDSLPLPAASEGAVFADLDWRGERLRSATLSRVVTAQDGPVEVRVTVAESTRARDALAAAILARSALRLVVLVAAAGIVAWIATTLALRPLNRVGAALALRRPDDLSPIAADVPQEIGGLVAAVNAFMARTDAAVAALRAFARHANHQIRTPLATARTQIALAERDPSPAPALSKADAALVRAERVLAQLLLLARAQSAGARPDLGPVDLARMVRGIAADLVAEAAADGQDLGYDGPETQMVLAEPVLLGELVRNLADNAIRHTPRGTTITLRVAGPVLTVEDNGPGLPATPTGPDERQEHGLGLLIVGHIAQAFGATLTLGPGAEGRGLCAVVTFAPP